MLGRHGPSISFNCHSSGRLGPSVPSRPPRHVLAMRMSPRQHSSASSFSSCRHAPSAAGNEASLASFGPFWVGIPDATMERIEAVTMAIRRASKLMKSGRAKISMELSDDEYIWLLDSLKNNMDAMMCFSEYAKVEEMDESRFQQEKADFISEVMRVPLGQFEMDKVTNIEPVVFGLSEATPFIFLHKVNALFTALRDFNFLLMKRASRQAMNRTLLKRAWNVPERVVAMLDVREQLWNDGNGLEAAQAFTSLLSDVAVERLLDNGVEDSKVLESIRKALDLFQYQPSREVAVKLLQRFSTDPDALLIPLRYDNDAPCSNLDSLQCSWAKHFPRLKCNVAWPSIGYATALATTLLDKPDILPGGNPQAAAFLEQLLAIPGLGKAAAPHPRWRMAAYRSFEFCISALCPLIWNNSKELEKVALATTYTSKREAMASIDINSSFDLNVQDTTPPIEVYESVGRPYMENLHRLMTLYSEYKGLEIGDADETEGKTLAPVLTVGMSYAELWKQPDMCLSFFSLFLQACSRHHYNPRQLIMLKILARTCDAHEVLDTSMALLTDQYQRDVLINGFLLTCINKNNPTWAIVTLAKAASMPRPSSDTTELEWRVMQCLQLIEISMLAGSASGIGTDQACGGSIDLSAWKEMPEVVAAAAAYLSGLVCTPQGSFDHELFLRLNPSYRDAFVWCVLHTGSSYASLAPLRPLMLDISPSQSTAERLLSDPQLIAGSPQLLRKMIDMASAGAWPGFGSKAVATLQQMSSQQLRSTLANGGAFTLAQLLLCDAGGGDLLLKFLEGSAARTDPVSTDARAQAVLSQSDWRQLVALMLDMCRGEEAPRHAAWAMRAIQMALAQSARPQPGRVEASGLVAETCWLVPQALYAPAKLRHAAAVGIACSLLTDARERGWHLRSVGPTHAAGKADADEASAVAAYAGLLAALGSKGRHFDRKGARPVLEWLQPCVADLCSSLARADGSWADQMCLQVQGSDEETVLFIAEACSQGSAPLLVDLLRATVRSGPSQVPQSMAELCVEAVAEQGFDDLEIAVPLVEALQLGPEGWATDQQAGQTRAALGSWPDGRRHAALSLLLSVAPSWPGARRTCAIRALLGSAELLPGCCQGNVRAAQLQVLRAYREAAALAAGVGAIPDERYTASELCDAAARMAGMPSSSSKGAISDSARPSMPALLELLTVYEAARLPMEAVGLAMQVLQRKLPLDTRGTDYRSSSTGSSGGDVDGAAGAVATRSGPGTSLDEQSVAAVAMRIACDASRPDAALRLFLTLLVRRGNKGINNLGVMQLAITASEDPSAPEDLVTALTDGLGDDAYLAMLDAAEDPAAGQNGQAVKVLPQKEWLAHNIARKW